MKHVLRSCCAIVLLVFIGSVFSLVNAQSPTPDPFVTQLTSSPLGVGTNQFSSFAGDISANGRFVVFESNGNVATFNPNNADGNREIFLVDYAQRRIFQITNTKNVPKASPTPTPSPSASPTPSPSPTPADPTQVQIEISNNRPMISYAPSLVSGKRTYTIVFSSNAPSLPNFDGTGSAALSADANQEIWIYQIPAVADVDLTTGDEITPAIDLTAGTFTQVTSTPASLPPAPGSTNVLPIVADDNRDAVINDEGTIIAFISTRNLVGTGNTDGNPELFFRNLGAAPNTFVQGTNTADATVGNTLISRFQQNPSLSADGSKVAFVSTADLVGTNNDNGSGKGNAEIYLADFSGAGLSNVRQVTKTKSETTGVFTGASVNLLSPGRRLSRDGSLLAFESRATDPKANSTTNQTVLGTFVYNVAADSFVEVGLRPLSGTDIRHFPTFTDYTGTVPGSLVFASALNFKTDGTFPAAGQEATGLNPNNQPQLFVTALPVSSSSTFTRLTNNPVGSLASDIPIRPIPSASRRRITFSLTSAELGGGNSDLSIEVYYLLSPAVTSEAPEALTFFTRPSVFEVPASPAPSPSPSATPTPTPGTAAAGFAPGELGLIRSTGTLAPSLKNSGGGSETDRRPILPIELNGVSVSINGAAAGLYSVSGSEIQFVVPIGVQTGIATVVVNNNGKVFRGFVPIVISQPDIFTIPAGPGGRAVVCNVTNTSSGCIMEPFSVTTISGTTPVPTVLEIHMSGVRGALTSEISVTIGTTAIAPSRVINNTNFFGEDLITLTLPASLAGAGDVPVVVTMTRGTGTFTSRGTATAPHITIN